MRSTEEAEKVEAHSGDAVQTSEAFSASSGNRSPTRATSSGSHGASGTGSPKFSTGARVGMESNGGGHGGGGVFSKSVGSTRSERRKVPGWRQLPECAVSDVTSGCIERHRRVARSTFPKTAPRRSLRASVQAQSRHFLRNNGRPKTTPQSGGGPALGGARGAVRRTPPASRSFPPSELCGTAQRDAFELRGLSPFLAWRESNDGANAFPLEHAAPALNARAGKARNESSPSRLRSTLLGRAPPPRPTLPLPPPKAREGGSACRSSAPRVTRRSASSHASLNPHIFASDCASPGACPASYSRAAAPSCAPASVGHGTFAPNRCGLFWCASRPLAHLPSVGVVIGCGFRRRRDAEPKICAGWGAKSELGEPGDARARGEPWGVLGMQAAGGERRPGRRWQPPTPCRRRPLRSVLSGPQSRASLGVRRWSAGRAASMPHASFFPVFFSAHRPG